MKSTLNVPEMALRWQPIETAPVNQSVLVFIPHREHYGHGVYRALRPKFGILRPWQVTGLNFGRDCGSSSQPTHWLPLPDAPPSELKSPSADNASALPKAESSPPSVERQSKSELEREGKTYKGEGITPICSGCGCLWPLNCVCKDLKEPGDVI